MIRKGSFVTALTSLLLVLPGGSGRDHGVIASDGPQASVNEETSSLEEGFKNPPASARPAGYWAWLNGYVDRDRLGWDLEQWKEKGLSKAFIFECGAKDREGIVPVGPAFMSKESVETIGQAIREAGRVGMELGFTTSSSWNAGGAWVTPEYASMGLFHARNSVEGPRRFSEVVPFPSVPSKAPRRADGMPAYYKEVAVLALPEPKEIGRYEFVLELAPPGPHLIDRFVLYNTESADAERYGPLQLFAKEFSVAVSNTTPVAASFREVLRGELQPATSAQEFRITPTPARQLRLTIHSGHNTESDKVSLGEFEAYTTDGKNVALKYFSDGSGGGANLLRYTSALSENGDWAAVNIYDGKRSGAGGSWRSGTPGTTIEDVESIVDLSDRLQEDGRLDWDVPPGKWTIMRFVCSNTGQGLAIPSPKSHGLAIDHFSADATRMHFEFLIDKLEEEVGPLRKTALTTMYLCSYELRGAAWTPEFLEQFQRRRGYDMKRYLPILFGANVGNQEISERFDYDFRKTQGDLLVDAFYKTAADVCREHGLMLCAEAGGPGPPTHNVPVDALKAQGAIDIPRGEFWTDLHLWIVKETACASHVYGKKIVDMEAFTSWAHWQYGPFELKPFADRAMCEGTNHFTFHTSPHTPGDAGMPGWVYHAGTHIAPSIAWWPKARAFIDYLARCSYLLQEGLFAGDVCYYYGGQAYNFVPPKHVDPSLGPGYDYDVTNAEVLLTRMQVQDGRLVLPDGLSYALLVLPERDDIDLEVLEKIEKLVSGGATVVGPKPTRSNGLADSGRRDAEVRQLAGKVWGPCDGKNVLEHRYGKGRVIWGRKLRDVLQARGLGPDFTFTGQDEDSELDYLHRRVGDADVYFVANHNNRWEVANCVFRVRGKTPELWLPGTGEIRLASIYRATPEGTEVPLRLPPHGTVFVVFRESSSTDHVVSLSRPDSAVAAARSTDYPNVELVGSEDSPSGYVARVFHAGGYTVKTARGKTRRFTASRVPEPKPIDGAWTVRFPAGWGAPETVAFDRLISWADHSDDGIKYFSGVATYEKEFEFPGDSLQGKARFYLDLGNVKNLADVSLNGNRMGILWKPPFRVDVTGVLRGGANHLRVEVANTWSNRLVGDAHSPEGRRYCQTNMAASQTWEMPWRETPLLESGLIGPVKLVAAAEAVLDLKE